MTFLLCILLHIVAAGQEKGVILSNKTIADTSPIDFNRRMALVIGNAGYKKDPLKNPVNDAELVAGMLKRFGFEVILDSNLNRSATLKRINAFGDSITRRKGVSLFYYSGHGMQYQSENYLLPLQANIEQEEDIENEAVKLSRVLEKMGKTGNGLNMVILDACRNNLFQEKLPRLSQGLTDKESLPGNTYLFFAASPGKTALDGVGKNSPFTESLVNHVKDSVEFFQVVKKVIRDVKSRTNPVQQPAIAGSPEDDFIFTAEKAGAAASYFLWPEYSSLAGTFSGPHQLVEEIREPPAGSGSSASTLYVLSIGIAAYEHLYALRYAAKDARDVAQALTYQAGSLYDTVENYLLIDAFATRYNILNAISRITKKAKAGDMIMFFFAGHNIKSPADNNSYFLTYDAALNEDNNPMSGSIEYEKIRQFLANAPCKSVLFLDGLYSPETAGNLGEIENGVAVLASTSEGEFALEAGRLNNGLLAKTLIDGLAGFADTDSSGYVNLSELSGYLYRNIKRQSLNRQTPRAFIDPVLSKFRISKSLPPETLKRMKEAELPVLSEQKK